MFTPKILDPEKIEEESFKIIESEMAGSRPFSPGEFQVVRRVIHASADFEFERNIRFHPEAVASGVRALRTCGEIVADVEMIQAGVSKAGLKKLGCGEVKCYISDPDIMAEAKQLGVTRAICSMRKAAGTNAAVYAIGNAPTALFELIRLVEAGAVRPALIVGVPVGFVSAVESKEALLSLDVPFITTLGRKGGTPVAVSILNAMIRLALEK